MMKRIIMCVAIALAFGCSAYTVYAEDAVGRVDTGAKLSPEKVNGEITKIEGDTYFVRDKAGKEVKFTVEKDMRGTLERPLKVGDKIEAQLTPEGYAKSIRMADSGAAMGEKGKESGGKDIGSIQAPGSIDGGKKSTK